MSLADILLIVVINRATQRYDYMARFGSGRRSSQFSTSQITFPLLHYREVPNAQSTSLNTEMYAKEV